MMYLLTAIGLTPVGSSTVHIYTPTIHNNTMDQDIQNGTYISLPDKTQLSPQADIKDPGGIQTQNPSTCVTTDPYLRACSHGDQPTLLIAF
jgi:hypothetical protein